MKSTPFIIIGGSSINSLVSKSLSEQNKDIIIHNMEEKIKSAKELKIKAVEQEAQIEESVIKDPEQTPIRVYTTPNATAKTNKQLKARAKAKQVKKQGIKIMEKVNRFMAYVFATWAIVNIAAAITVLVIYHQKF